jgi:hypothetical protein
MLEEASASPMPNGLLRLRRLMELERELVPERGLSIDL